MGKSTFCSDYTDEIKPGGLSAVAIGDKLDCQKRTYPIAQLVSVTLLPNMKSHVCERWAGWPGEVS